MWVVLKVLYAHVYVVYRCIVGHGSVVVDVGVTGHLSIACSVVAVIDMVCGRHFLWQSL